MTNIEPKDFYKPAKWNFETKNQIWMSELADSHDIFCDCDRPFAHLLASIFPPGHQDRDLSINQILQRDLQQPCHSGGDAAAATGLPTTGDLKEEKEDILLEGEDFIKDEELQNLIDAGEDATGR